jgi:hypothetical protein
MENSALQPEKSKKTRIRLRLSLTFTAEAGGTRERIFARFFRLHCFVYYNVGGKKNIVKKLLKIIEF